MDGRRRAGPHDIPNGFAFYDIHERLYSIAIIPIEK
jgi:hypothetical protein